MTGRADTAAWGLAARDGPEAAVGLEEREKSRGGGRTRVPTLCGWSGVDEENVGGAAGRGPAQG